MYIPWLAGTGKNYIHGTDMGYGVNGYKNGNNRILVAFDIHVQLETGVWSGHTLPRLPFISAQTQLSTCE